MSDTSLPGDGASGVSSSENIKNNDSNLRRRTPWSTVEGRVISLISRKGGVGKTTSAVNLGAALALSGHSVLIVGTDPQCGVCRTLGTAPEEMEYSLTDIFSSDKSMVELAQASPLNSLFFISPKILNLEDEENYLSVMEKKMDHFIKEIDRARTLFDTILIDCPPSLNSPTRASLLASDSYLVPIQAEELCRDSLGNLIDFVGAFRARNFPANTDPTKPAPLEMEGMFLTMANARTRIGKHVAARVSEDFAGQLFCSEIPRNTRLSEMALRGKPAVIYDRRSTGSRAYFDLADEMVNRYCDMAAMAGEAVLDQTCAADFDITTLLGPPPFSEGQPSGDPQPTAEPENMESGGGLDRFLAELGGSTTTATAVPPFEEPKTSAPEMVSLDDLMAEEEKNSGAGDEWEDGYWSSDDSGRDRLN